MKIRFLGTGAAEGIPSFGCTCQRCQVARKEGVPNVRQRASVLIEAAGHRILLDTPPEIRLKIGNGLLPLSHRDSIGKVDQMLLLRGCEREPHLLDERDKFRRLLYNTGEHGNTFCWNR